VWSNPDDILGGLWSTIMTPDSSIYLVVAWIIASIHHLWRWPCRPDGILIGRMGSDFFRSVTTPKNIVWVQPKISKYQQQISSQESNYSTVHNKNKSCNWAVGENYGKISQAYLVISSVVNLRSLSGVLSHSWPKGNIIGG